MTVHVARFMILNDNSPDDVRVYGLPRRNYPLYLAFLGNVDGDAGYFSGRCGEARIAWTACDFFLLQRLAPRYRSCRLDEEK